MDCELRELLAPISIHEFLTNYWGRRYLYIRSDDHKREKLSRLLELATFAEGAARVSKLSVAFPEHTSGRSANVPIKAAAIDEVYAKGGSICASRLQTALPHLAEYLASLKLQLGYSGEVRCSAYLSPDAGGFTGTHFDAVHTFIVQTEGEKLWRLSPEPFMDHPPLNGDAGGYFTEGFELEWARYQPPDENTFDQLLLRAGDVLYFPPGTWHYARACGHSLALTIAFRYDGRGRTADLVLQTLLSQVADRAAWSRPPALGARLDDRLQELRALLDDEEKLVLLMQQAWRASVER